MASLKDIAVSLNLSIPLVSKVLSGKMGTTGCSQVNKDAIFAKAKELDYQPNLIARALRTGRTGAIGVFIHPMGTAGSNLTERLLAGLTTQANVHEQRLWLSFYETDSDFLHRFSETTRTEIDGLLVVGIFHPELAPLYKAIEANGIPVVTMIENETTQDGINVFCEDFQVGYLPTRHLLEQGCRKIAHIRSMESRYQGYRTALKEFGIQEEPQLLYTALHHFNAEIGHQAVQHWTQKRVPFDGLVAASDHQAFGATSELLKQGYRVPEEVKVFGVDDSPICDLCPVPLSSVSLEVEALGCQAVDTLMKRINGESVESLTTQPVLHLRASTK